MIRRTVCRPTLAGIPTISITNAGFARNTCNILNAAWDGFRSPCSQLMWQIDSQHAKLRRISGTPRPGEDLAMPHRG
ncbi:MAG: hypothetical protein GXY83_26180 [Rhodopirellula sp.]|nr:hypothetical protein [Rhodopirellula sp.]